VPVVKGYSEAGASVVKKAELANTTSPARQICCHRTRLPKLRYSPQNLRRYDTDLSEIRKAIFVLEAKIKELKGS
jgi:hypothetical protein